MEDALTAQVLGWESALLTAESLGKWLEIAADPPGGQQGDRVVSLLLSDPTYELRHLAAGNHVTQDVGLPVTFVDSLVGVAPQLAALHEAWSGEFRAADDGLLFPGVEGLRHLLMVPLIRNEQLIGVFSVATRGEPPSLASARAPLLAHIGTVVAASVERLFDRARLLRGGLVDALTGWHSHRYLQTRLREEIARSQRRKGTTACLIVDVDHLQRVNDDLGQPAGDAALREIAQRIESLVRSSDTACRFGSDEFAVLMPDTEAAQGVPLAQRILGAVRAAPIDLGGGLLRTISVSIGIAAVCPAPDDDRKTAADQILADAMAALHRVKRRGGDGYEIAAVMIAGGT